VRVSERESLNNLANIVLYFIFRYLYFFVRLIFVARYNFQRIFARSETVLSFE